MVTTSDLHTAVRYNGVRFAMWTKPFTEINVDYSGVQTGVWTVP